MFQAVGRKPTNFLNPHRVMLSVGAVLLLLGAIVFLLPIVVKGAPAAMASNEVTNPVPIINHALGAKYWVSQPPEATYPDTGNELTDGIKGSAGFGDPAWQGHSRNDFRVVTVDLGDPKPVDKVHVGFLSDPGPNIHLPSQVILFTSLNGRDWSKPRQLTNRHVGTPVGAARQVYPFDDVNEIARYVRVVFYTTVWTFIDEIEVWGEDRTVTAEGPTDLLDVNDPYLGMNKDHPFFQLRPDLVPTENNGNYMAAGTPAVGGARHMMLVYTHQDWSLGDALPYVAYSRRDLESSGFQPPHWEDWFFDTFLFLALRSPSGHAFDAPSRGRPATWKEWTWFLDFLFAPNKQLAAFDQAVAHAKRTIDDPDYKAKVVVMIPFPMTATTDFGDPAGKDSLLDFSPFPQRYDEAMEHRLSAIDAYLDEFFIRWEAHEYKHLELIGLYWLAETAPGSIDFDLTRQASALVQKRNMKFFWIPYYNAAGWAHWSELGFDGVMYQPNYMFNTTVPPSRFAEVAERARQHGMGIEIEADGTVLYSNQGRERYYDYLRAGVEHGFMNDALHGYYQEVSVLVQAFASNNPAVHRLYDATYEYVKGVYVPED